jgi:hypothetical protein
MIGGEWADDEVAMNHFHDAIMGVSSPLSKLFEHMYNNEQFGQTPPFLICMLVGKFVGFYAEHFNNTIDIKIHAGKSEHDAQYESYLYAISHLMEDPVLHAVVQMGVTQGVNDA